MKAIEYFRYHSLAPWTSININAMFYGSRANLTDDSRLVFQYFSDNGYITGQFVDECILESIAFYENKPPSFPNYRFDHNAANIACDPNFDTSNDMDIVLDKGRNTHFRRCLYGQNLFEIQLEYVKQFWDAYPDVRKVFRTRFNENHEATGELIKYNGKAFIFSARVVKV